MPTGACGIHCDVCRLYVKGVCSSCGPGNTQQAAAKLAAQHRLLGAPCPILACAVMKQVPVCLRDCELFPCENFEAGPYPFSRGFLEMQARRRRQPAPAMAPDGSTVVVDAAYWEAAARREPVELANLTLFTPLEGDRLRFDFLGQPMVVDLAGRRLMRQEGGRWVPAADPLLELVTVLYLNNVRELLPLGREMVGARDLREGHFFQGPHAFRFEPLLARYGQDAAGFAKACERLGGEALPLADAAFRLNPFPRIPLYYLLWEGDAEFRPRAQVLFDRSIEAVLAADAIWALVNRVTQAITATAP